MYRSDIERTSPLTSVYNDLFIVKCTWRLLTYLWVTLRSITFESVVFVRNRGSWSTPYPKSKLVHGVFLSDRERRRERERWMHTFGTERWRHQERWRWLVAALGRWLRGAATSVVVGAGRRRGGRWCSSHGGSDGVSSSNHSARNPNRWVSLWARVKTRRTLVRMPGPLTSFIWRVWLGAHNPGMGSAPPIRARLVLGLLTESRFNPNSFGSINLLIVYHIGPYST